MADEKNVQKASTEMHDSEKSTSKPAEPVELGVEELEQRIAPMTLN